VARTCPERSRRSLAREVQCRREPGAPPFALFERCDGPLRRNPRPSWKIHRPSPKVPTNRGRAGLLGRRQLHQDSGFSPSAPPDYTVTLSWDVPLVWRGPVLSEVEGAVARGLRCRRERLARATARTLSDFPSNRGRAGLPGRRQHHHDSGLQPQCAASKQGWQIEKSWSIVPSLPPLFRPKTV